MTFHSSYTVTVGHLRLLEGTLDRFVGSMHIFSSLYSKSWNAGLSVSQFEYLDREYNNYFLVVCQLQIEISEIVVLSKILIDSFNISRTVHDAKIQFIKRTLHALKYEQFEGHKCNRYKDSLMIAIEKFRNV
jgi:hypothetical protein